MEGVRVVGYSDVQDESTGYSGVQDRMAGVDPEHRNTPPPEHLPSTSCPSLPSSYSSLLISESEIDAGRLDVVRALIPLVPIVLLLLAYSGWAPMGWLRRVPEGEEW